MRPLTDLIWSGTDRSHLNPRVSVNSVIDWTTLSLAALVTSSMWLGKTPPDSPSIPTDHPSARHNTVPAFPPAPAALRAKSMRAGGDAAEVFSALDKEIMDLAAAPPDYRDEARRGYEDTADLYGYMVNLLPGARKGDAASQYYISMALEECRAYLRLDATAAFAMLEASNDWPAEDRAFWDRDYFRCRNFAGGDLTALLEAMSDPVPGAITEYASVWFERAAQEDYPPALAELALQRSRTLNRRQRLDLLQEAVATGDPVVYWHLFAQTSNGEIARGTVPSLAWLIVACRAGMDCRDEAQWSRVWLCSRAGSADCQRGESALEYYWRTLSPQDRLSAYQLAAAIEADMKTGTFEQLPWPGLPGLDDATESPEDT